jgi:hypothetical protein
MVDLQFRMTGYQDEYGNVNMIVPGRKLLKKGYVMKVCRKGNHISSCGITLIYRPSKTFNCTLQRYVVICDSQKSTFRPSRQLAGVVDAVSGNESW